MKTYMPLNGLRWSRNSGSANCDMPQSAVFGRPGGVKILINKHKNPWQRWGGDIKGYAVTQNFLNALQHASGKYIFLADQDDVWASDRIKEVLQCLKRHEGTLVVCNASLIDAREKQLNKAFITRIP